MAFVEIQELQAISNVGRIKGPEIVATTDNDVRHLEYLDEKIIEHSCDSLHKMPLEGVRDTYPRVNTIMP